MQKKGIYIWMAGVSLLLILLIIIQLMWMRHAAATEERETKLHVMKALERAEDKLRNTNYCMITYSKLYINPHQGFYMVHQPHDSTGFHGAVDTVHMYTNDEEFTHSDTVLYEMAALTSGNYPVSVDMQFRFRMVVSDTADYYREQQEFHSNRDAKRLSERVANSRAIADMFDMSLADSLIANSLAAEHVQAAFGFGFISSPNNKVAYAKRVADSIGLLKSPYAINIFTDNKFIKPHRLAVMFPGTPRFSRMHYWLILSVFIIALLTISFYVFVRLYVTQTRLSEMKSDFINNLTHEFNTPIANITLALETLGANTGGHDDKINRLFEIISAESSRLRGNIDKALQAAAMDRGDIQLRREEIDLVAVTKTILSSYRLQCEQLGGHIDFLHPGELAIQADETHLLNCICNLLDNAIKYRHGAPVITITLRDDGKYATLIVADNGMGMSSETQKHIFEKFYRAHEGDTHNTKGFGLGLSYVQGIIDAHNGKISVWSKPGTGTTFTIHLPKL